MVTLDHVVTLDSGPTGYLIDLSDLALVETATGTRLFCVSARGGGVLALDADDGLATLDVRGFVTSSPKLDAPRQLGLFKMADDQVLYSYGQIAKAIDIYLADGTGSYAIAMRGPAVVAAAATAMIPVMLDGGLTFVMASRQVDGLAVWQTFTSRQMNSIEQTAEAALVPAGAVAALASYLYDGVTRILALSATDGGLYCYRLGGDGVLALESRLDGRDGLAISAGTKLEIVTVDGQEYALVGAAGSGSLAVVRLGAAGQLLVTDHVLDELGTRFDGLSAMATATVDGQVYVAVAGADDGVTVMTLLPGGRLVHLLTIEGDVSMALTNPAALAMRITGGVLDLFVAGGQPGSEQGSGITHLQAELGQVGVTLTLAQGGQTSVGTAGRDQIVGGSGNDRISGAAGDDILVDGTGSDTLSGGTGEDVFVLVADGQSDRIIDFEPGVDRLDLSELGRFYSTDMIGFAATKTGATLRIGNDTVVLDTASGRPLTLADLPMFVLKDLTHLFVAPINEPAGTPRMGSEGDDYLDGRNGDDHLIGGGGRDVLIGGEGADTLIGDQGDAVFDIASSQVVRLYQAVLDRLPDPDGLLGWIARLTGDEGELLSVVAGFVGSPEFQQVYGQADDPEFITLLYENVLNRPPDPTGLQGWLNALSSGQNSREQVVIGFSESAEFKAATALLTWRFSYEGLGQGFVDDVFRLYRATLGRDPDLAGLTGWVSTLIDGQSYGSVISGFVDSAEFDQKFGLTTDHQFVSLLYANVLNRAPDAEGLGGWVDLLESGALNRAQAVAGFAQSPEFTHATRDTLAAWMRTLGVDDRLEGGPGRNVLQGGMMADHFIFQAGEGSDNRIVGLEHWDTLSFQGFGYDDPSDIRAHFYQDGADMVFSDQDVMIRALQFDMTDLVDDMFLF